MSAWAHFATSVRSLGGHLPHSSRRLFRFFPSVRPLASFHIGTKAHHTHPPLTFDAAVILLHPCWAALPRETVASAARAEASMALVRA